MRKRILILGLCCTLMFAAENIAFPQAQQLSPTETVRLFYKTMREKKYKEAFALSIYKPAVEGLNAKDLEDLRPDFERMAAVIPEEMELSGEMISGDSATVFVKVKETAETAEKSEPIQLMKLNGVWIVGDPQNQEIVKKAGTKFFFDARINAHHDDVQDMLTRITLAQVYYSQGQGHSSQFGNMAELIGVGALPKDIETSASTGYIFHINRSTDGKTWWATAEPAQYGRSGKLSFYVDAAGVKSADVGGKPLPIK